MCGIAGLWNIKSKAPADADLLGRMARTMRHRGPDDQGMYVKGDVGLAHARLSIVDLAGGHQPMSNEDGTLWIVFNGEIYNHPELRPGLIRKGHVFRTSSDTEVILHLYEEVGEDCLHSFNGQFAFAIWDARSREFFLARDRMGVRPLFYTFHGGRFRFASEMKAIFADPDVPRALDLQALDQVFTFWFPIPPRTGFADIQEIPPGCKMRVTESGAKVTRFWQTKFPDADALESREGSHPDSWYEATLLELLDDAVRIRLRADVEVAAYLSGGLDSSVITALARRHIHDRLKTFSIGFESEWFDESSHQSKVVDSLRTEHHPFLCKNVQVGAEFPRALWFMERPVLRTAPVPMMLLSKGVREAGIKVVLTGEGADELLAGYDIFKEAKLRRFWAKDPKSRMRPMLLRRLYPYLPAIRGQSSAYLAAFFGQGLTETEDPLYSHRPRWQVASALKRFYGTETAGQLKGYDPVAELAEELPGDFSRWHPLSQAQFLETAYLLPCYLLSSQGDRMGLANSVEGRFPFLDHRVVEFAAAIPPHLKLKCLREKHVLREAAHGLLPDPVLERTKQPYRAPDQDSFFPGGEPHNYVLEALSPTRISEAGLFAPEAVTSLLAKARKQSSLGTKDGMALVGLLSTQILFRQFVANEGVASDPGMPAARRS